LWHGIRFSCWWLSGYSLRSRIRKQVRILVPHVVDHGVELPIPNIIIARTTIAGIITPRSTGRDLGVRDLGVRAVSHTGEGILL
jgi:hypothetical protein